MTEQTKPALQMTGVAHHGRPVLDAPVRCRGAAMVFGSMALGPCPAVTRNCDKPLTDLGSSLGHGMHAGAGRRARVLGRRCRTTGAISHCRVTGRTGREPVAPIAPN